MPSRRGPDNACRIVVAGTQSGLNWANIFSCQLTTSGSIAQADLDTWTTAFLNAWKTRFLPVVSTTALIASAKTTLWTPGNTELISTSTTTGTGTGGGGLVDLAASAVISWNTNVYWRGGKPRTYLPNIPTASISADGHTLASTPRSNIATAAANFRSDINALTATSITGTTLGFVSYFSGNQPRTPAVFYPITGVTVHPRVGTQRRRLGKWQL